MKAFTILWIGELVSMLGSRTSGFALSVWIYQVDHDVTKMALVVLMSSLPGSLVGPLLGPIVDAYDRKKLLLVANFARAGLIGIMAAAALSGRLDSLLIYGCQFGIAIFAILSTLTLATVPPSLVEPEELLRANGMMQTSEAIGHIAAPTIAGIVLTWSSLPIVFLIDFVSFFAAILAILFVSIPSISPTAHSTAGVWSPANLSLGLRYLNEHKTLGALLLFITVINFLLSMAVLLFRPLVLSTSSPAVLGFVLSTGAAGMLVGAIATTTGMMKHMAARTMLYAAGLCGVSLGLAGISTSVRWFIATSFVCFLCAPIIGASNQAIWQTTVPRDLQGRVFAIGTMLNGIFIPAAQLIAGPLADHWFEPAMRSTGVLAPTVGKVIGVGPGRGIGLMLVLIGITWSAAVVAALISKDLRSLDINLCS